MISTDFRLDLIIYDAFQSQHPSVHLKSLYTFRREDITLFNLLRRWASSGHLPFAIHFHILASSRKRDWKQTKQRELKISTQLLFYNLLFCVICVNTYMPNQVCVGQRNSVELVLSFHLIKLSQCSEFFLINMVSSQEEMLFFYESSMALEQTKGNIMHKLYTWSELLTSTI